MNSTAARTVHHHECIILIWTPCQHEISYILNNLTTKYPLTWPTCCWRHGYERRPAPPEERITAAGGSGQSLRSQTGSRGRWSWWWRRWWCSRGCPGLGWGVLQSVSPPRSSRRRVGNKESRCVVESTVRQDKCNKTVIKFTYASTWELEIIWINI